MPQECVKVMVRVRPMNDKERQNNSKECVEVDTKLNQIVLRKPNEAGSEKVFSYDAVFYQKVQQQFVYEASAFPLVESVFEGYNGTIFAYGQTGCGKTHTMMGDPRQEEEKGIIPRTFSHIINLIETTSSKEFLVRVSFLEIYNEEIHDLLSKDPKAKFELKQSPEKGVFVKDLNQIVVKSVKEMENLMYKGNENRSVGATAMNKDSSRSHSIFTIYIETSEIDSAGNQHFRAGKLNLVDLAGSERQSKTQATGDRLKEANKINLSLSALGNVISALVDGKTHHIPYRDSKLTRLLEDSLGGNTKTIMIAAISPADYSYDETLGTLRYASRAKNIKNQPKVNEDPKDALLKEYAEEINRLRRMLENQGPSGGVANQSQSPTKMVKGIEISESQVIRNKQQFDELKKLQEQQEEMNQQKQKMMNEMQQKEEKLQEEKRLVQEMAEKLKELEQNKMQGGNVQETQQSEAQKKYQELRKKLKKQNKLKEQLLEEKRKNEENLLQQENEFKSLQEEVSQLRENNKILRKKLKQALEEVKDLQNEHEDDKEELLDTIRHLELTDKLNKAIIDMLLTRTEYEMIKSQSTFDEDSNSYKVPPFFFKNKEIRFPKLPQNQAMEQVNVEKESRRIEFEKTQNSTMFEVDDSYQSKSQMDISFNSNDKQNRVNSRGRSKNRKNSITKINQNSNLFAKKIYFYYLLNKSFQIFNVLTINKLDAKYGTNPNLPTEKSKNHYNQYNMPSSNLHNRLGNDIEIVNHSNPKKNINGIILDPVNNPNANNLLNLIEKSNQPNGHSSHSYSAQPEARKPQKNGQLKPLSNAPAPNTYQFNLNPMNIDPIMKGHQRYDNNNNNLSNY
ncbi:hypothetical protein ABPG73_006221 [Tetrahymena malaccensis]